MLLRELTPTHCLLRCTGLWTCQKFRKGLATKWCYTLFVLSLIAVNVALFSFNMYWIELYGGEHGLVNVQTMSYIINALKPLHAALNLGVFLKNRHLHNRLTKTLMSVDAQFRNVFEFDIRIGGGRAKTYSAAALCFLVPFALRLSEYVLQGEYAGRVWIADLSLILVPMLTVWQMLPLYYYYCINSTLTRWFRYLNVRLAKEDVLAAQLNLGTFDQHPLTDYTRTHFQVTGLVYLAGSFFNAFVFCSMGVSLSVLCITIYYVTAVKDIVQKMTATNESDPETFTVYYVPAWTAFQILVAVLYLLVCCVYGWKTNEAAREISPVLLSLNIQYNNDSKFEIDQIMHKIYTQFNWGISIWRIVLFERSLLVTMISAIITYAMVLIKLQPTPCNCFPADGNYSGLDYR